MDPQATFDESELRAAEHRLEIVLEADDATAWVFEYAEDAVFDAGGEHAAMGRPSLLAMARSMRPLGSVSISRSVPRHVLAWRLSGSRRPGLAVRRRANRRPSVSGA